MAILSAHEFGHYIAGRLHGVPISPPYFIPLPPPMLLGTMGAVIRLRGRITDRAALLDVGVSGPLAGLCVALPVLVVGLANSPVGPLPTGPYFLEGRSLLYSLLVRLIAGSIAPGNDILLNGMAFAGWAGLLVTMMNLIPVGQLDGGHIAYALWGPAQNRVGRWVLWSLAGVGLSVGVFGVLSSRTAGGPMTYGRLFDGAQWLLWFALLWFMGRRENHQHPPFDGGKLNGWRTSLGYLSLLLLAALFMPRWLTLEGE